MPVPLPLTKPLHCAAVRAEFAWDLPSLLDAASDTDSCSPTRTSGAGDAHGDDGWANGRLAFAAEDPRAKLPPLPPGLPVANGCSPRHCALRKCNPAIACESLDDEPLGDPGPHAPQGCAPAPMASRARPLSGLLREARLRQVKA